jgi:hypothetical protein
MFRFIINVLFCLLLLFLLVFFVYERLDKSYDNTWAFKLDATIQGILAALLFLVIVFVMMKPSIRIASMIAELPAKGAEPGHLRLKIVNNSLFRAYDLTINVYHKRRIHISGPDVKSELLGHYEGNKSTVSYLESALFSVFESTKTNAAQIRFKIMMGDEADLAVKNVLEADDSYLEVHLTIRHGLSGLQGNYVKRFDNISCIKRGFYAHGFRIGIKS